MVKETTIVIDIKKMEAELLAPKLKKVYYNKDCYIILMSVEKVSMGKVLTALYNQYRKNPHKGLTLEQIADLNKMDKAAVARVCFMLMPVFVNVKSYLKDGYIFISERVPRFCCLTEAGVQLVEDIKKGGNSFEEEEARLKLERRQKELVNLEKRKKFLDKRIPELKEESGVRGDSGRDTSPSETETS